MFENADSRREAGLAGLFGSFAIAANTGDGGDIAKGCIVNIVLCTGPFLTCPGPVFPLSIDGVAKILISPEVAILCLRSTSIGFVGATTSGAISPFCEVVLLVSGLKPSFVANGMVFPRVAGGVTIFGGSFGGGVGGRSNNDSLGNTIDSAKDSLTSNSFRLSSC